MEGTKEGLFKETIPGQINLFSKKANHFAGFERTLKLLDGDPTENEAKELADREYQAISTTVAAELDYIGTVVGDYFDIMLQRDEANQRAVADVVIDGVTIASNVPATTLLALENKLKQLRPVYAEIPTLQPGITWELDASMGEHIYKDKNPEVRAKTKKGFDSKVIVQATDKFPAQIEKWETVDTIGHLTKIRWCSMISVADKSKLLARFDKVAMAVKQARQRANEVEVNNIKIGADLFSFINQI